MPDEELSLNEARFLCDYQGEIIGDMAQRIEELEQLARDAAAMLERAGYRKAAQMLLKKVPA